MKLMVTVVGPVMVTVHCGWNNWLTGQAPPQLAKLEPMPSVLVSVTTVPTAKSAVQVVVVPLDVHESPVGLLTTEEPKGGSCSEIVTVRTAAAAKVAETEVFKVIVTVQVPVPPQAPPQPVKSELAPGLAVRVTTVPSAKVAAQVAGQLIPAGELVTVPLPVPAVVTVSVKFAVPDVEVNEWLAFIVSVQVGFVPLDAQSPPQPLNTVPGASGVAVIVTTVPAGYVTEQGVPLGTTPQALRPSIGAGESEITTPRPIEVPVRVKVPGGGGGAAPPPTVTWVVAVAVALPSLTSHVTSKVPPLDDWSCVLDDLGLDRLPPVELQEKLNESPGSGSEAEQEQFDGTPTFTDDGEHEAETRGGSLTTTRMVRLTAWPALTSAACWPVKVRVPSALTHVNWTVKVRDPGEIRIETTPFGGIEALMGDMPAPVTVRTPVQFWAS